MARTIRSRKITSIMPTEISFSAQFVSFPNPRKFGDEMGRVSDRPKLTVGDVEPECEEEEEEEAEAEAEAEEEEK